MGQVRTIHESKARPAPHLKTGKRAYAKRTLVNSWMLLEPNICRRFTRTAAAKFAENLTKPQKLLRAMLT
jgi:hypothetical protein